ncbi:hypothetical protein FQA39_LY06606 [Lamprigera yunnana]|nr:hypothetical protein FQA39_LY06606 [Lamprigera yunnana]
MNKGTRNEERLRKLVVAATIVHYELRKIMMEEREKEKSVKIEYQRITIDNKRYDYDSNKQRIIKNQSKNREPERAQIYRDELSKGNGCARKVKESESDSNSDGEIEYDDSTDTDVEKFLCGDAVQSPFTIELEKYYAVQYEEQWYIGRVISRSKENFYVTKFLKQEMDVFVWPKNINTDISKVHKSYIFYGPIDLIGCEPFRIARTDLLTINKSFGRQSKQLR